MPRYAGVTTDLRSREWRHRLEMIGIRNWTIANGGRPFRSRAAAEKWQQQQDCHLCGDPPPSEGPWYGYTFEFERRGG